MAVVVMAAAGCHNHNSHRRDSCFLQHNQLAYFDTAARLLLMTGDLARVLLVLAASLAWGSGDFSGGLAARRASALSVVVAAHAIGLALLVILALAWSEAFPSTLDMLWGGAAGVAGTIGLVSFYRALAVGRMGITAPITAVDRKSTRLNSSHTVISYAVFCLKKKNNATTESTD